MKIGQQINFIYIPKQAYSLYSLIADGQYRGTAMGRNWWKKLIGSQASLQYNCNKEGFNAVWSRNIASKARIGILGNNINDCSTCKSRIGFSTGGFPDDFNTCGNEAIVAPGNGDKNIKAMGYILVKWLEKQSTFKQTTWKHERCDFQIKGTKTAKISQVQILSHFTG